METSQTPVTPARQAMVRIAGYEVMSICMASGTVAAGFRMICDLLGVDHPTQIHKLQADSAFRDCFILAKVEIAGKQRVARFIIAEFIPLWLKGIHPSKVSPEARETLIEFQRVAVQTLRAFFFPETRIHQQSAPPKQEPKAAPLTPPQEPPLSEVDYFRLGSEGIVRKQQAFEARLESYEKHDAEQDRQLAIHKRLVGILSEQISDLMADDSLAFAHQIELQVRLQALEHQSGQSRGALERELAATFGVRVIEQLPEADWGQIVEWFQQRLGW